MANDYCTADELKQMMPDVTWTPGYDELLAVLATRASRLIDAHLKRAPGAFYVNTDATYYLDGSGSPQLWIPELATAPTSVSVAESGITTSYTAWSTTDYLLWPYNAIAEGRPFLRIDTDLLNGSKTVWYKFPRAVKIVGKLGFSATVPDEIKQAAIIQAVRLFKRGQQAFQDTGAIVELGQLKYTQKLDPDVAVILEAPKYQRLVI